MIDWVQFAGAATVLTLSEEFLRHRVVKPVAEILERSRQRDEDWNGTIARPGVPGRPGVMAELGSLKEFAKDTNDRVTKLESDRETAHAEALKMWAAIEAVAKSSPPSPA